MSEKPEVDHCTRQMIEIGGERYYLLVGSTFVMAICPRENSPAMTQTRALLNDVCGAITAVMENRAAKSLILAAECNKAAQG
jgi:hypothetical protein